MTNHTPPRCANIGMVGYTGKILLLDSGNYPSYSSYLNETWLWNGTNGTADWTNLSAALVNANGPLGPSTGTPPEVLSARINQVMAFDGTSVMLYGGQGSSETAGVFDDTWTFNTGTLVWTLQSPATVPFGRYNAEAAYLDGASGNVLMFGGETANQILLETWLWNGTTWSQVAVANGAGPAARIGHVMDGNLTNPGTVLMFGGQGLNGQFNDTWTYTAAAGWTKLVLATSPSVRSNACMSYDNINNVWVMFGGQNAYGFLDETWTYTTAGGWVNRTPANGVGPSGRISAQMSFDSVSSANILFGGINATSMAPDGSTWSFSGSTFTWTAL